MFSSPLQRALRRGLSPQGNLIDELRPLRDYKVRSKADAKAIVEALARFPDAELQETTISSPLHGLCSLFQDVESRDAPAFEVLRRDGTRQLIRIFDERKLERCEDESGDLLFLLKILASYATHEGAERIVEAARLPLEAEDFMWSIVLSSFSKGHPERNFVFASLADPLPPGFIAVSLLDAANGVAIAGDQGTHVFDTDHGRAQLRTWLRDSDPERFSYAHSATAALPFLSGPDRDELLGLAREHTDPGVCIEAAWASAKLGYEIGLARLADYCRDATHSATAIRYLEELGREDAVPREALEPEFRAKANFANWLSHPNELGQPPDELTIVDRRELFWPPEERTVSLWLIQYVLRDEYGLEADDVDCGLVGSTTWCFFSYNMHLRPPEDCYAIHCCWELDLESLEVDEPAQYADMLEAWPHGKLVNPIVTRVMQIPPHLKYGRRLVALAKASMNNEAGWAVLDGSLSGWYPASEMPADQYEGVVLPIHVGRRLLRFTGVPDRRQYLSNAVPEPAPAQIVEAYENLLHQCKEGDVNRRAFLVADWKSPLGRHLERYAESCASIGRGTKNAALIHAFQTIFDAAESLLPESSKGAYGYSEAMSLHFDAYVDAMVESERRDELAAVIQALEPHWDHNSGYGQLGRAAYQSEDWETAERLILKLRESYPDWRRSKEMSLLARIWHQQGHDDKSKDLLLDCMNGLIAEATKVSGSDPRLIEDWYQNHRSTLLELYPNGKELLAEADLPVSSLK